MPEGHSIHRIARQFRANFAGRTVRASSPQGRFAAGAARLDGRELTEAKASGKHLFLGFGPELWLHVHLGIYGAWDFAGEITVDDTIASSRGRIGQTNQHGTVVGAARGAAEHEDSLASIGAPRRARLHMAETEKASSAPAEFPPEPVGQVRVRLLTDTAVADLRGPTVCELLDDAGVAAVLDRLGPDPALDGSEQAEDEFVRRAAGKTQPIAVVLMDQSVVGGIGNIYRAELLFRHRLDPFRRTKDVGEQTLHELWRDWDHLLAEGIRTGQMLTMDGLDERALQRAMASRADRHWVYKREGLPCRVCGTSIAMTEIAGRKLYWCPFCQKP